MKRYTATFISTLKDAVVAAFWYKGDLEAFLETSLSDESLLDDYDWVELRKRDIVDDLVNRLADDDANGPTDIDCMARGILEMTRYPGLEKHERAEALLAEAVRSREALRACMEEYVRRQSVAKRDLDYDFLKAEYERRKREDEERLKRRAEGDELRKKNPDKYYGKVLKLKGKVTKEGIKERYRELIKAYHPDRFSHLDEEFVELATARTQQLNEAFQYLSEKHGIKG